MRAILAAARARTRERLRATRVTTPARRRRRVLTALLVILLLILALFLRCSCEGPPAPGALPPPAAVPPPPTPPPQKKSPAHAKAPPLSGQMPRRDRATYDSEPTPRYAWLDAFRLQVTARSPRLAECFRDAPQPGALRWTCAVDPDSGAVADHLVEPVGATLELSGAQRSCLIGVLSEPHYNLTRAKDAPSTPARVGIVIEF